MSKQPLQTDCFEDVFLDYLELRWRFEPLRHYVMAAIQLCHHSDRLDERPYPDFVKGFLDWSSYKVVFEEDIDRKGRDVPRGSSPVLSTNSDPLDAQWRRFEDCHDLLAGWIADDLKAALERQSECLELVKRVEQLRATKSDEETFNELEEWFGEASYTLRRRYQKIVKPKHRMGTCIPIALVKREGAYVIETRAVGECP